MNKFLGLMKVTAQSFTPQPATVLLESVYDVRSWLAPYINDLHGHSQPHCFRFSLNKHAVAVMHYKNWSHEGWSQEGIMLLKVRSVNKYQLLYDHSHVYHLAGNLVSISNGQ